MGMIIAETSIGRNLFDFANKFLGRRRGGVASATVVAAGLMGAVTGSDNVSCVIMSKMALPELKRLNYADSLATASWPPARRWPFSFRRPWLSLCMPC